MNRERERERDLIVNLFSCGRPWSVWSCKLNGREVMAGRTDAVWICENKNGEWVRPNKHLSFKVSGFV